MDHKLYSGIFVGINETIAKLVNIWWAQRMGYIRHEMYIDEQYMKDGIENMQTK